MRAMTSTGPPADEGAIRRTGRVGYCWAAARGARAAHNPASRETRTQTREAAKWQPVLLIVLLFLAPLRLCVDEWTISSRQQRFRGRPATRPPRGKIVRRIEIEQQLRPRANR